MPRWRSLVVVGALLLAGAACDDEGGGGADDAAPAAGPPPTSALLASIEADGTDAEQLRVGTEGEVSLAVVDDGDEAVAYLCDGYAGEWLTGPSGEGLVSAAGTVLTLDGEGATIAPTDGDAYSIELEAADGDDDLLRFSGEDVVGGLVVHDGVVRGSARTIGGTASSRPSPTIATTTTAAPRLVAVTVATTTEVGASRISTNLQLPCEGGAEVIAATFAAMRQQVQHLYGSMIAALEEIQALDSRIAERRVVYDQLVQQQVAAGADAVAQAELRPQVNAVEDEITALVAERSTLAAALGEPSEQIERLRSEEQDAIEEITESEASALAAWTRQCQQLGRPG